MNERILKLPRFIVLILASLICAGLEVLRRNTYFLEKILPFNTMNAIKGAIFLPFSYSDISFAEIIICAAAVFVVGAAVYFIVRLVRSNRKGVFFLNFVIFILALLLCLRVFFLFFCGIDYNRTPLHKLLGLNVSPQSVEVLYDTALYIQKDLNIEADKVTRDKDGLFSPSRTTEELLLNAHDVFEKYTLKSSVIGGIFSPPKPVRLSEVMNYLSISGFYFPYTGEANVNTKEGALYLPYTACHEKAHQHGIMREGEASYLAYLACINSGDTDFRYSALVKAYQTLSNQLYAIDRELYYELTKTLDGRVIYDITAYRAHLNKYSGKISDFSEAVNDTYLKSQGQLNGTKSYGELADLIIAQYLESRKSAAVNDMENASVWDGETGSERN